MNLKEIQDLIKFVSKSGVSEVELEQKDFKITIKTPLAADKDKKEEGPQYYPHYIQGPPAQPMPQQQPQQAPQAPPAQQQEAHAPKQEGDKGSAPAKEEGGDAPSGNQKTIKAPMIGTFYRRPSPDKEPFVKTGDTIKKGDTVCVIEAMKLFNEIEAEFSGKIVKVIAEDSTPVEYDQPLFIVEPDE